MKKTEKKKVLILGASFSYVGSIKAAREMGNLVLVADRNPQAVGFQYADIPLHVDITDIDGCIKAGREHAIDAVVAVNDFGVLTAARVSEALGIPGLPVDVAVIASDKYLMRQAWEKAGVPSIPFVKVTSVKELKKAVQEIGLPAIIKPCDSRGGGCRGVQLIDEATELQEVFDYADSFYQDQCLVVEKFVTGLEHSVEVIVYDGQSHIIAISDKVKSPLPYRVDDTILYPTVETGERLKMLEDAVARSISAIGMKEGIAHVELSMTDDGPVLFEIGARCGGGAPDPLVPFLSGVEEFKEAVRIALGEKPVNFKPLYSRGCVIKFAYPTPGIVQRVSGVENVKNLPGVLSFGVFVKKGDRVGPLKTCSDRAAMVIAGKETREDALNLANHVIDTLCIETV
ncbi:MAG: ATP-grasp domain-containing protein [bacterium]|nr:ATP-grasp domain-containing protein [bacterium]